MVFPQQSQFGAGALIGEGIADIFGGIEQKRQQEQIQRTLEDPNVSPLQKALALKDNPKLAAEFLKQQRMSQLGQHLRGLQESFRTPGIAPPEVEASTQSIRAQPTQTRESESLFGDIPESALQETMALYPELQGAIKEELTGRREREKLEEKRRIEEEKKEERTFEKTEPYVNTVLDAYKGTKTTDAVLGQMTNLAERGNLTSPVMSQFLGKIGLSIGVLNNPDSEEFDKLSNNLTRDIQKFYGSRILQTEFQNFLRQIPTLNNSPEGRKRIIENMQKMLQPPILEYETMKDIIRENEGKRPRNLKEQVIDRMEPQLDAWAAEFKQNTKTPQESEGMIIVAPDGRRVRVPKDKVAQALSQGGRLE